MDLKEPEVSVRDRRAVRRVMNEIKASNLEGLLVPEEVVSAAAAEDSPIHGYFTWDNDEASHQWRLHEARALIRHVEVIFPDDKQETPVPKYVSLMSDRRRKGGGYRETGDVLNNKELLAELEATAKKDIDGVLKRYEVLKALCVKVRQAAGINTEPKARAAKRRGAKVSAA